MIGVRTADGTGVRDTAAGWVTVAAGKQNAALGRKVGCEGQ